MSDPGIGAVELQGVKATAIVPLPPAGPERVPPRPDGPVPALLGPPAPSAELSLAPLDAYSLRLVSSRTLYDAAVMTQASPALAGLAPPARLRANPYDLDRLGVTTGGQVRVVSARAAFVLPVEADPGVPRGAAWLGFHQPDGGAAALIDSGEPVTDVRLETPGQRS
jgi:anaerobic selenocysteine-containing dehydrogenase